MKSTLVITTLVVGQMATNCYIAHDAQSKEALIIDPGDDAEYITDTIAKLQVTPIGILLTHGHFDHCLGAFAVQIAYGIPCMMHPADSFLLARMQETAKHFLGMPQVDPPPQITNPLKDKQMIEIGNCSLRIQEAPGHTPGSIIAYDALSPSVFVGDTIFADGAVGSTDHEYSSRIDLKKSIHTIFSLPKTTRIYAGHGEQTTVELAQTNIYV